MAQHNNPYNGIAELDETHLIIQLRSMVAEELEAANLYQQFAAVIKDEFIRKQVLDIANEELVHAGEFSALIDRLTEEDGILIQQGMEEVWEN